MKQVAIFAVCVLLGEFTDRLWSQGPPRTRALAIGRRDIRPDSFAPRNLLAADTGGACHKLTDCDLA